MRTYHRSNSSDGDGFAGAIWFVFAIGLVFAVIFNRFRERSEHKKTNHKTRSRKKIVQKTHYEVLGVKPDAHQEEITMQYRKLAWRYHPDKNRGNERLSEIRFKEVSLAYDTLKDKQAKAEYDQSLAYTQSFTPASRSANHPKKTYRQDLSDDLWLLAFLLAYIFYYLYSLYRG